MIDGKRSSPAVVGLAIVADVAAVVVERRSAFVSFL